MGYAGVARGGQAHHGRVIAATTQLEA
jgi:hypothetical protein